MTEENGRNRITGPQDGTTRTTRPAGTHRLGTRASLGLTGVLVAAVGGTAGTALWISGNGLRTQAEEAGRQAAVTAATSFTALAEPSAANTVRTLDIVLDDQLQAQAAATAMLIETAESAGHDARYIEDALSQIAGRSPIRRIDVTATEGASYSTERTPLGQASLEPAFAALAATPATGRTATAPATQTATGLSKAAAAQPLHRQGTVRIEQEIDSLSAARAYGGSDDQTARSLAGQQATAIARLVTHAIELAQDAGWENRRIDERLDVLARNTTIEYVAATVGAGQVVYDGGRQAVATREETTDRLANAADAAIVLDGEYDEESRWLTRAAATRADSPLTTLVEIAARTGEGTLVESAWQTEANRLATVDGITGVWIAEIAAPAGPGPAAIRLAAAAPGPAGENGTRSNAWERWNESRMNMARRAARLSGPTASSSIRLLSTDAATLLSAAPIERNGGTRRAAVVIENRADAVVERMRRETATGLAAAAALIAILGVMTTWTARRWLTNPIEAMAEAADHLQAGERPPEPLTAGLKLRRDEIGRLARSFNEMTDEVLARHEELTSLIANKTHWLQESNTKLQETQERISSEIGLARTIQQALVPQGCRTAGELTLCSRMTPARELGGDFISINDEVDGNTASAKLFIAVCDVSGKGVAAALFMTIAQNTIAEASKRHQDVREIAGETNRALCAQNPLGMFVTGVIAIIHTGTGHVEYAIAGHEPPLSIKPGKPLKRLSGTNNLPLGLEPTERYERFEHQIADGETIAAYTDGITDACNSEEELFGERRLQELLADSAHETPEDMLKQVWTAIDLFSGRMPATDDKTCALIKMREARPRRRA